MIYFYIELKLTNLNNKTMSIFSLKSKEKSTNELVAEIHETFNTEVDRLLLEAGIQKSIPDLDQTLKSKAERLRKIGFNNTIEANLDSKQQSKSNEVKWDNAKKNGFISVINYFSNKYPMYKFITEDSVKKICEKYNLVYGEVGNYIGDVPEKNLIEIENFKLDEVDELWISANVFYGRGGVTTSFRNLSKKDAEKYSNERTQYKFSDHGRREEISYNIANMEIAAPLKDFNTRGMEIKDFKINQKIEIPDPVVLCPVFYKNEKYYLIITAWGLEASDELVVNEKFN